MAPKSGPKKKSGTYLSPPSFEGNIAPGDRNEHGAVGYPQNKEGSLNKFEPTWKKKMG